MMKNISIVIVFLAGVLIVTYLSYGNRVDSLLSDLDENMEFSFSSQKDVKFNWMIREGNDLKEVDVIGSKISIGNILLSDYNEIKSYFTSLGFVADDNNQSLGTTVGLFGYQKNNIVCSLVENSVNAYQCLTSVVNKEEIYRDLDVKCGVLVNKAARLVGKVLEPKNMEVREGEVFSISLSANLSTGYRWQPFFDPAVIEVFDIEYIESATKLPGAFGNLVFHLRALKKNETEIVFSYMKPYNERAPIRRISYMITIRGK